MGWFAKGRPTLEGREKTSVGAGLFRKCDGCGETHLADELERAFDVCPRCQHHHRLPAERWAQILLDPGTFEEFDEGLTAVDALEFRDGKSYGDRLKASQSNTGEDEAIHTGFARIDHRRVAAGFFLFQFMGGSMGSVVGERIARLFERATEARVPVLLVSASGGARMQEGIFSLMQMAKTVSALGRHRDAGLPFLSLLTHPTTGGVAASFALLGDVNIAEPRALIGFAGPRVIEQTIRQKLPEGFQTSEFLIEHGMVDVIAERRRMRETVARLLAHMTG